MKSLINFINEKQQFLVKGHLRKQTKGEIINFPVLIDLQHDKKYDYEFVKFKKIQIGEGPFYIYNDKYHNKKHIAGYDDITGMIGVAIDDFEDFSAKDVIADFKHVKDAVIYMLKDNGASEGELSKMLNNTSSKDVYNWINRNKLTNGYYDKPSFATKVLTGECSDEDITWEGELGIIDNILLYADIKNLPNEY